MVLEIKTFNRPWDGELPDYWRIQGIQQAICADVDRILWGVFDSSLSMQYYTQEVSEEEKEEHITKASEWLAAIDMNMTPPGVTWSFETIAKRYTAPERGSMLEIGEQHAELVAQLKHVKNELKSYKELEDKLKADLCELIGNHDGVTINGDVVATWKGQTRSSFNTKLMQLEHPDIVDKYTNNITVRTLLLKGAK
jgi:predicted phage-related endonuclease